MEENFRPARPEPLHKLRQMRNGMPHWRAQNELNHVFQLKNRIPTIAAGIASDCGCHITVEVNAK
jgi:hypothetical protein